jgi:hypothetical protein
MTMRPKNRDGEHSRVALRGPHDARKEKGVPPLSLNLTLLGGAALPLRLLESDYNNNPALCNRAANES